MEEVPERIGPTQCSILVFLLEAWLCITVFYGYYYMCRVGNPSNIYGINWAPWTVRFLNNVLDSSMEMVSSPEGLSSEEIECYNTMEAFPIDGSEKKIGDKILVKLSNDTL